MNKLVDIGIALAVVLLANAVMVSAASLPNQIDEQYFNGIYIDNDFNLLIPHYGSFVWRVDGRVFHVLYSLYFL